ncbi:transcription termination factor NusA [Pasteuria penetrans]|uniref:transcription termination factor NusA n=1 Tax=Pasteuria penetrans TaxID=86005 RepID=UPI000FBFFD11|nr:transcription termination factor NusA [Pasteuria penetrans]
MNAEFMEALLQLEREKGISKDVLIDAIEAALISGYKRNFHSAQNVRVDIDRRTGRVRVLACKDVVEEGSLCDPQLEMTLEQARKTDGDLQLGDTVEVEVTPADFGRIAAQTAKQVVTQRLREAERSLIYQDFAGRVDDVVTGVIQRVDPRYYYTDLGRIEALLPHSEMIPGERFRHGERVKVFVTRVEKSTKGPQIFLSRTHPGLLRRLFELEVPEIAEGLVTVRSVVREPGHRSKVAVHSLCSDVDPVGACVGQGGARVRTIVNELHGEKIDIVRWSEDLNTWISNALSPAETVSVEISEGARTARVLVPDHQLSLAIGKEGQNARLAAKLTNWRIDIKAENSPDTSAIVVDVPREGDEGQSSVAFSCSSHSPESLDDGGDDSFPSVGLKGDKWDSSNHKPSLTPPVAFSLASRSKGRGES